jgi:hypothetical protein
MIDQSQELERRVRERVRLELQALSVCPGGDFSGLDDDQLRARCVSILRGVESIDGKDAAYVRGLYDGLIDQHIQDPVRRNLIARADPRH